MGHGGRVSHVQAHGRGVQPGDGRSIAINECMGAHSPLRTRVVRPGRKDAEQIRRVAFLRLLFGLQ